MIVWTNIGRNRLQATVAIDPEYFDFLDESDMEPIQKWCTDHNCGVRTSFDTFKFKSKKDITMFLLTWSS